MASLNDRAESAERAALTDPANVETVAPPGADTAAVLVRVLDRYMADLQAGNAPDRERLLAEHPDLAAQLERCLGGIDFLHRADTPASAASTIGEFRIVREVGRGGMGVVYDAEQTSLKRRVALKVLRFGVVADDEATSRFQREAETVARLHHTNIVPIFAVGSDHGVHYYAMQFIEGQSLADTLAERLTHGKLPAPEEVAEWGLSAAEALAHAHQRGVIHRDIKPSNLLLDTERVLWLTDFGLAKRADEVTMTLSGTVMGTPRYMSPEQAESLKHPIDHRTDLYSLGASLYELATGQPVFESPTPHGVIAKILTEEPTSPRQLRPGLPKDLETIIQTCLAKDPQRRYASAQALADDLRAFLDGRPIKARRLSLAERAARLVRKQKRSIQVAIAAATVSAVVLMGGILATRAYEAWKLGHVDLKTENNASYAAEILEANADIRVGDEFTVPTKKPLSLPAGPYRLRLSGAGMVGETFQMPIERGATWTIPVQLADRRLWKSKIVPVAPVSIWIDFGGETEILEIDAASVRRRSGKTGDVVWETNATTAKERGWSSPDDFDQWIRRFPPAAQFQSAPAVVQPAPDLDGDKVGDIIIGSPITSGVVACSGRDGRLLWHCDSQPTPARTIDKDPDRDAFRLIAGGPTRIVAWAAPADVNADGVPDVLATVAIDGAPRVRWIEALSGRGGKPLWRYRLTGVNPNTPLIDGPGRALVLPIRGETRVVVMEQSKLVVLDAASGRPAGEPIDVGFAPSTEPRMLSLDDAIELIVAGADPAEPRRTLVAAFGLESRKRSWQREVLAELTTQATTAAPPSRWPLVEDLDGNGVREVIVPSVGTGGTFAAGVAVLDGATGQTRWARHPHVIRYGRGSHPDLILVGPDADGDGVRDLFSAATFPGHRPGVAEDKPAVFVDAYSGRDGAALWRRSAPINSSWSQPTSLLTWQAGSDGLPMVLVGIGGLNAHRMRYGEQPTAWALEASTGQVAHTLVELAAPESADLDRDGIPELLGQRIESINSHLIFRGRPATAWTALGNWQPAEDFDGDGVRDVVKLRTQPRVDTMNRIVSEIKSDRTPITALSGKTGEFLWEGDAAPFSQIDINARWDRNEIRTFPMPFGDFDNDGAADVLAIKHSTSTFAQAGSVRLPIVAISGKSGATIWKAPLAPLASDGRSSTSVFARELDDLDRDERPDLIVAYSFHYANPAGWTVAKDWSQHRVCRLSARDGRVIWDHEIGDRLQRQKQRAAVYSSAQVRFGDLDGDGVRDVIATSYFNEDGGVQRHEIHALSGRDGTLFWTRQFPPQRFLPIVLAGDLDGDARDDVITAWLTSDSSTAPIELSALERRSGKARWSVRGGNGAVTDPPSVAVPLSLVRIAGKKRAVCVNFGGDNGRRSISLFDHNGHEFQHKDLKPPYSLVQAVADLDGDGIDEILFEDDQQLKATSNGFERVLWSRPATGPIRELLPAANAGSTPTILVGELLALDGKTGARKWELPGVSELLTPPSSSNATLGLRRNDEVTTVIVDAFEEPGKKRGAGRSRGIALQDLDPRTSRPLPWMQEGGGGGTRAIVVQFGISLGLFLAVFLVPFWLLRRVHKRHPRSVQVLLLFVAIAAWEFALFRFVYWLSSLNSPAPSWPIWGLVAYYLAFALSGFPLWIVLRRFAAAAFRAKWNSIALYALLMGVTSVICALIWLRLDLPHRTTAEHYDWSEWYGVLPFAVFLTGIVLAVGISFRWTVLRLLGLFRRRPVVTVAT